MRHFFRSFAVTLIALGMIAPAFGQPSPPPLNVTGTSPVVVTPSGAGSVPRVISCPTCSTSTATGTVTSVAPNADNNCIVTSPNPITGAGTIDVKTGCLMPATQGTAPFMVEAGSGGFSSLPATNLPVNINQMLGGADGTENVFGMFGVGTIGSRPSLSGFRAAGTRASPTNVIANSGLQGIAGWGWTGGGWGNGPQSEIILIAEENFTNATRQTGIAYYVTPHGTINEGEQFRMSGLGHFLIGTSTDNGNDALQTAGTISVGGCGTAGCGDIALLDKAQTYTASQRGQPGTITISTSTFTPNFDTAQNQNITLIHASCPCTIANPSTTPVAGQSGMLAVAQSSTGSDTVTWGSQYKFASATAPTLSTGANAVDFLPYYVFSATQIIVGAGVLNAH